MIFDDAQFEAFLEDITVPFLIGDVSRWRARIRLPFSLITQSGPVTLTTDDEVKENFALYLKAKEAIHYDLIVRKPVNFETCPDGTVIATYHNEFLYHGLRVRAPYTASALLHPDDGVWRMSSILNALGHHQWTGKHPYLSGEEEK